MSFTIYPTPLQGFSEADWRVHRDAAAEHYAGQGFDGIAESLREIGRAELFGRRIDNAFCAKALGDLLARIIVHAAALSHSQEGAR